MALCCIASEIGKHRASFFAKSHGFFYTFCSKARDILRHFHAIT